MVVKKYILNVDLMRRYSAKTPEFRRGDSGTLIFRVFNDGVEFDISRATKAEVYHETSMGTQIPSECTFTTLNGKRVIQYDYEKIIMVELGFTKTMLVIYEGDTAVSIIPFNVWIYSDMKGGANSYLELIQDLANQIEDKIKELNNAIPQSDKGKPNGVASLDGNSKIPLSQMPKEVDSYLKHMTETVAEHHVHGQKPDADGLWMYQNPITGDWQYFGFSDTAAGGGAPQVQLLEATIVVLNGIANITYTGTPTLALNKWSTDTKDKTYFATNGTTFTGSSFAVSQLGMHTLFYRDSNGVEYVKAFAVTASMMPSADISVDIEDGYVTVNIVGNVSIKKWAKGEQSVSYFAYNGTAFTGDTFEVTEVGKYTIYYKLTSGLEYVHVFNVSQSMLPKPDTIPPSITSSISYSGNNATITVNASDDDSGISYIKKPDNTTVSANSTTYVVSANDTYRFYAYDNAGNNSYVDTVVSNILLVPPVITLSLGETSYTKDNIAVYSNITSSNSGSSITTKKWASGSRSVSYFNSDGTSYPTTYFYATENGTYTVYAKDSFGAEAVKTITVSNIDRVSPSISLSQYPTSYTNGNVTITANVTDSLSGIYTKQWASGSRSASYFTSSGGTIFNSETFNVTSNGTYTVYAKDRAGNEIVQTITINNITTAAPTITLTQSPTSWTNSNVTISANISSSITLSSIKYASGSQSASYFASSGTNFTSAFSIASNGTYTVYAKDSAGNEVVKTITISNIDSNPPSITLSSSGTTVNASISDSQSGISARKWASGNRATSYFTSNGATFTGSSFSVSSSGTYTVYAIDNAGNASVQIVAINGDTTPPSITLEASRTTWGDSLVTIDVTDASGIDEVKYASGSQSTSYFASNGDTLDNYFFLAKTSGTYTVYARDMEGNESVKTINVTLLTNNTGYNMGVWSSKYSDGTNVDVVNIVDSKKTSKISDIRIWWGVEGRPVPISFFTTDRNGVYMSLNNQTSFTNYSTFYSYRTVYNTTSYSYTHSIELKRMNVPYGYFTSYFKLTSGEEFISYGSAL